MIVLDTHTWLWWASGSAELPPSARKLIDDAMADAAIAISCISSWEIAMLVARKRLQLSVDVEQWIRTFDGIGSISFIPVSNSIGLRAVSLPGSFHADPADRIIVATAISLEASLVTRDARIRAYAHVRSAW